MDEFVDELRVQFPIRFSIESIYTFSGEYNCECGFIIIVEVA